MQQITKCALIGHPEVECYSVYLIPAHTIPGGFEKRTFVVFGPPSIPVNDRKPMNHWRATLEASFSKVLSINFASLFWYKCYPTQRVLQSSEALEE